MSGQEAAAPPVGEVLGGDAPGGPSEDDNESGIHLDGATSDSCPDDALGSLPSVASTFRRRQKGSSASERSEASSTGASKGGLTLRRLLGRLGAPPKGAKRQDSKRVRRPSLKVYQNPSRLSSGRRPREEDVPAFAASTPLGESAPQLPALPEGAALRGPQLQAMLGILAQLYGEKVSRQDTEIQGLRTRLKTMEKLLKEV